MDPYATFLPLLCEAVSKTTGDVIEVGVGDYSTFVLHALCLHQRRRLVSVDTNPGWVRRLECLRNPWHQVLCVQDYARCHWIDSPGWDVAFVDHAPGDLRVREIRRLSQNARFIVVHDTEEPGYGYGEVFAAFPHRYEYRELRPFTTILSMTTAFP